MMGTEALSGDWAIYTRILILAAVLCLIAVIVLVVPALFDYLRRWRENRRMYAEMQTSRRPSTPPDTAPLVEQVVDAKRAGRDALGWSAEDEAGGSVDWRDQPGVEPGTVLGREKTILIADDDPVVAFALSRRLQNLGFQVFRSPDAAHALMGAMKMRPDLVILDVNMPSGNGLAVCEMMACDRQCANIPVIVHSVFADEAVKQRCRRLGAHHVEKSPKSWTEIKSLVESLIGGKASQNPTGSTAVSGCAAESAQATATVPPSRTDPTPPVDNVAHPERSDRHPERSEGSGVDAEEILRCAQDDGHENDDRSENPKVAPSPAAPPQTPPVCGRSRVLCIESPKDRLEFVDHQLSALGMEVVRVSDLEEGFWTCFTENPQVVVVQSAGGGKKLLELLRRLAEHPVTRDIPVLLIDEGDAAADNKLRSTLKLKVLKHPMDWENFLGELEAIVPAFGRNAEDPLASIAQPNPKTSGKNGQPPVAAEQKPLKVLCIDDDPVVARSIATRLQPYGIKVKSATNGTQGYLMAATDRPDLILLDLKMPNGEGGYVLSKLKDNERTKEIPVIVLTIETHPGVRRQMLSGGANAFLTKPVRWPELFAEMGRCIQLPEPLMADYKLTPQLTLSQL